ncbi:hypothetical protein DCCM_2932 [Desulfocucumis palustris]|uniref:Uncharacterized protein n=1 Tax=Desulfocucumis palustris TaxID=1898651 RepID=A0A2L2XIS7_9FIRM|nr:hypothetical protein DCCM_2932 [Desulfocucumis palustris]
MIISSFIADSRIFFPKTGASQRKGSNRIVNRTNPVRQKASMNKLHSRQDKENNFFTGLNNRNKSPGIKFT